jgi:hypothetical protein
VRVRGRGQHAGGECAVGLCAEVLVAGPKAGEGGGKSGLLSSLSGAMKTATRAVKTAMVLDDSADGAAEMLRPWSAARPRTPP